MKSSSTPSEPALGKHGEARKTPPPSPPLDRVEAFLLVLLGAAVMGGFFFPHWKQPPPGQAILVEREGAPQPAIASGSWPPAAAVPEELLVDLNRAGRAELMTLPGIGPALSEAILEYRERHGEFKSVADLDRVPGIGPAKLEALAGQVVIGSALPDKAAVPSASRVRDGAPDKDRDTDIQPEEIAKPVPPESLPQESGGTEKDPALVRLNEMREEDLVSIPGIGPALAGQILTSRESLGGFVTWDQVGSVPGIGPKRLENLREKVRIP